jgi:uncharacterized membrane protein
MISEHAIEIDAPIEVVWSTYAAVEHWPDWTASVRSIDALDGAELSIGRRYRISQPRFPTLVWQVSELEPGRSWSWEQRSPGGCTLGVHEVEPLGAGRTLVTQRIEQRGPIGGLVGRLMRRTTRRYLEMEADGLKQASEARADAATS